MALGRKRKAVRWCMNLVGRLGVCAHASVVTAVILHTVSKPALTRPVRAGQGSPLERSWWRQSHIVSSNPKTWMEHTAGTVGTAAGRFRIASGLQFFWNIDASNESKFVSEKWSQRGKHTASMICSPVSASAEPSSSHCSFVSGFLTYHSWGKG